MIQKLLSLFLSQKNTTEYTMPLDVLNLEGLPQTEAVAVNPAFEGAASSQDTPYPSMFGMFRM